MASFTQRLMMWQQGNRYAYPASFLSGALASLSLPPAFITPAFLLFGVVLYQAALAPNWRIAARHLGLGAYGWFVISLYWISHSLLVGTADYWFLIPFSFLGIPILVAAFWVISGLVGYQMVRRPLARLIMMMACLGAGEWAREFVATGFPWNAPGLIFLSWLPFASLASYIGQTGLNFLAFIAAGIVPLWLMLSSKGRRIISFILVISLSVLGALALSHYQPDIAINDKDGPVIRLVQPAIAQAEKWEYDKRTAHLAQMVLLSNQPFAKAADLVIWPEAAFAGLYGPGRPVIDTLADKVAQTHQKKGGQGQLLLGTIRYETDNQLRNAALLIARDKTHHFYDKTHLVPFGEYVPWRFIPFIDAIAGPTDFTKGPSVTPLQVPDVGLILPLICYEAIFPWLTGHATTRPDVIVNLTNDGWFGHTAGPYQHLAQTQMTAISYGLPVLRVANTGISAVIAANGTMISTLPLGTSGVIDTTLPPAMAPTFFARYGHLPALSLILIMAGLAIALDRFLQKRQ